MACEVYSSSTVSLKIAVLVLVLAFVLHAVGFALPRWSVLESDISIDGLDMLGTIDSDFHVGLWKDCSCASIRGIKACHCVSKVSTTGTFKAVQAMETIGLIGLIVAGAISLVTLFSKPDKSHKFPNIFIVFGSGVFIVTGVTLYAVECNDDYDHLFSYMATLLSSYDLKTNPAHLSISIILCTIAGALCLLACTALLLFDYCTAPIVNRPEQQLHSMQVQYMVQGQIITPAPGQVIMHNVSQHPTEYMPPSSSPPQYQPVPQLSSDDLPYKQ